jgi:hypothetical protein
MKDSRKEVAVTVTVFVALFIAVLGSFGNGINTAFAANVNSIEVEQIFSQIVNCPSSACIASPGAQVQVGPIPVILNLFNNFNDVTNSVEIEQIEEQVMNCDSSA